jgi:hypothetical protein
MQALQVGRDDRVVHHATVLKTDGDSFRLKVAKAKAGRGKGAQTK